MLYYFTGEGTPEDILFASLLGIQLNDTCVLESHFTIDNVITYLGIKPLTKKPNSKLTIGWFTPKAFKLCTKIE